MQEEVPLLELECHSDQGRSVSGGWVVQQATWGHQCNRLRASAGTSAARALFQPGVEGGLPGTPVY